MSKTEPTESVRDRLTIASDFIHFRDSDGLDSTGFRIGVGGDWIVKDDGTDLWLRREGYDNPESSNGTTNVDVRVGRSGQLLILQGFVGDEVMRWACKPGTYTIAYWRTNGVVYAISIGDPGF